MSDWKMVSPRLSPLKDWNKASLLEFVLSIKENEPKTFERLMQNFEEMLGGN